MRALVTVGEGYGNIIMATPLIRAMFNMNYDVSVLCESHWEDAHELLEDDKLERVYTNRSQVPPDRWDVAVRSVWGRGISDVTHCPEIAPGPRMADLHEVEANMVAARKLGYAGVTPAPFCATERPTLAGDGGLPDAYIAVCSGYGGRDRDTWARKAWPYWELLPVRLPLPVVYLGSLSDWQEWMGECNLCGKTSIAEAAWILDKARVVLAIDCGLAHIAAALGKPTVILFGPTSETKNRPMGRDVTILTAPLHRKCGPCQMTERWDACSDWQCMKYIQPPQVSDEVRRILRVQVKAVA